MREFMKDPYIMEVFGNLARHAEKTLIRKMAVDAVAVREGVSRKMEAMRADLNGSAPTPLGGLLVERIAVCWLHLYHLEYIYANKESMSLDLAAHYQRCIDRAHKRFLTAIKTLAV